MGCNAVNKTVLLGDAKVLLFVLFFFFAKRNFVSESSVSLGYCTFAMVQIFGKKQDSCLCDRPNPIIGI